nr:SpoIID/LytB domain-containing protein [Sedimentibacter sp.]
MKKYIKILIITIVLLMFSIGICFGAAGSEDTYVRVRVRYPRGYNEHATLKGYDNIYVYGKNGSEMAELFQLDTELNVLLDTYYDDNLNVDTKNPQTGPYHVKVKNKLFNTFEEAQSEINKIEKGIDLNFYPYYNGERYEISAGSYVNENSASDAVSELSKNSLDGEIFCGSNKNIVVCNDDNDIVFMYINNYNIYFTSYNGNLSSNVISIDKKPYRGMMGFYIIEGSKLISINYVDLESYLYGVVPNEIVSSWPVEAVKAQVLAARTYAMSCMNYKSSYGYDLEDSQDSQVYRGYASEYSDTNKAVDATKGEMIYYDGELIQAFFHSSSGGRTENSENIWVTALPYLRSVDDEYSNISPQTEWNKVATKDYVIGKLKADGNDINDLYGIEISDVSENYRVLECIFLTDKGKITYKKENVRRVLGYDFLLSSWFTIENSNFFYFTNELFEELSSENLNDGKDEENESSGGILDAIVDTDVDDEEKDSSIDSDAPSKVLDTGSIDGKYLISSSGTANINKKSAAFISKTGVSIQNNDTSEYNFSGRGWGHGIGMSQYGAKEMATEGFTYEEILKYYYTGVTIK